MDVVPETARVVQVGDEFGGATVLGVPFYIRWNCRKREQSVVCQCSCGEVLCLSTSRLKRRSKCTCAYISVSAKMAGNSNSHKWSDTGFSWSRTRLYRIHEKMRDRCYNQSHKHFHHYGGRGITICDEWLDFGKFKDWAMESGYQENLTIERLRVNEGYCPENCTWITQQKQLLNKRNSFFITAFGETKTCKEWSQDSRCVVGESTLRVRLFRGIAFEEALSTPKNNKWWKKGKRIRDVNN